LGSEAARVVWERAVEAKGGRARLATIASVAVSSTSVWGYWPFSRIVVSYEKLLVPPGQLWHWMDERPSKFGLRLDVIDMQRGTAPIVYEGFPPKMEGKAKRDDGRFITRLQLITLLETPWTRPVLRRTWDTRWRRRAVSVVEAEVNGDVYEFTFARDSHLLVRLVAPPPGPNKPWECQLADYTPVQGIPMPAKVTEILSSGIKATERNTYALNVDYDERIFVEPPTLARGPKGWQRPR
jgi:hypothetical protein